MSGVGILFVSFNRETFTRFALDMMIENTDWRLVSSVTLWDDYSQGDDTLELVRATAKRIPVDCDVRVGGYRSPVSIMNRYVKAYDTPLFAKLDNDVIVPPGWLTDLLAVMDGNPDLEALGMQAAFTNVRGPDPSPEGTGPHSYVEANHIGGVGLMRRAAFLERPPIQAEGRFGWTLFQEKHDVRVGWITPDLHVSCLDQIPFDPWASLSTYYTQMGWQRPTPWTPYDALHYTSDWWPAWAREKDPRAKESAA